MLNFDDIYTFVEVVKHKSIVKAGKSLSLNYTSVGRRIKNIESYFGEPLLISDRHNFILTDLGKKVYQLVNNDIQIFELMNHKIISLISDRTEPSGRLRVQLTSGIPLYKISPHIHKFIKKYPKVDLEISYKSSDVDLINEQIDLALINQLTSFEWQKSKLVASYEIKLYCTKEYEKRYGIPQTPEELENHMVAGGPIGDANSNLFNIIHKATGKAHAIKKHTKISSDSFIHQIPLLDSNEIIIPSVDEIMSEHYADLITVLPDYYIHDIKLYILKNPYSNRINIDVFSEFLISCLNDLDYY